jgi:hypothetical protein
MPGAAGDDYMSRVSSRRPTSFLVATRKDAKKRSPGSAPRSEQRCEVPSLRAGLKGFSDGTSLCRRRTPGSVPGRFAPVFRLRASLGLSKGDRKTKTPSQRSLVVAFGRIIAAPVGLSCTERK